MSRDLFIASDGVKLKFVAGGVLPGDEHLALKPLQVLEVICGAVGFLYSGSLPAVA